MRLENCRFGDFRWNGRGGVLRWIADGGREHGAFRTKAALPTTDSQLVAIIGWLATHPKGRQVVHSVYRRVSTLQQKYHSP